MEQNYEWQLMANHAGKHPAKQSPHTLYMNPLPTYGTPWYKMDHNRHVHEDKQQKSAIGETLLLVESIQEGVVHYQLQCGFWFFCFLVNI